MSVFRLLIALSICSLAACGGTSDNPSTPVTVQTDPATDPLDASDSAAGDAIGRWYCAATGTLNAEYIAYWNDAYQLEFSEDRTLLRLNESGADISGTWWYTNLGVTIQWVNGDINEYQANVANRGGMADDNSHCLRELPPTGDSNDEFSSDSIPTYDCGNGTIVGFASRGRLIQNGVESGQWRTYLGNGIGTPTPTAASGFTFIEFNDTRFTVIEDTLLQEFGEWSCFTVNADGPLLQLLAPVP